MSEESTDTWHETLMAWGAYRSGYTRSHLGYGRTIYERMIAGLKGVTCSKCIGRGVVTALVAEGQTERVQCPVCKGKGKVKVATPGKINPACIPATGGGTIEPEEPAIYRQIDQALRNMTLRHRIAIITRYRDYPRRNDGVRRWRNLNAWFQKIGYRSISQRYLESELLPAAKQELRALVDNSGITHP